MRVLLVTGGAGFIGSNFIRYFLETNKDFIVVNYDKLTYAGNLNNLKGVEKLPNYRFVKGDICDCIEVNRTLKEYDPDYIVNFAAESHVDRSISGPSVFGQTNFMGTLNLLQCAYEFWGSSCIKKRFLQVSTDEVYGSIENDSDYFIEDSNLMPNSPYSASKAGSDMMVRAFSRTYGLPVIITRCCNNYGPYQYREKFIPTCIIKALNDEPIPIYGAGTNIREWIHVSDHCSAIIKALFYGTLGETYNIGSGEEISNVDMARIVLSNLGKPAEAIIKVNDRLGHDRRYALDSSKIKKQLSWACSNKLEEGIKETIEWYKNNQAWWND
ncbi:MAG: dTDP-glucose 4,6-dehydratase [Clostridiaceae bacterium]|nr:dTDP-glucose 4,6-dehydratase [Clostridiaceae bacterium]